MRSKSTSRTQELDDTEPKDTPVMSQYKNLKKQYEDCLLCFRLGDFYELFAEDATNVAQELGLTLTSRNKGLPTEVPMCGFPHHVGDIHIARLVKKGYKVALCEQVESVLDRTGNRPLKREVTRVITAGTLTEDSLLDTQQHNFLLACSAEHNNKVAYAIIDISTGDFFTELVEDSFDNMLAKWNPSECLIPESIAKNESVWKKLSSWQRKIQLVPNAKLNAAQGEK